MAAGRYALVCLSLSLLCLNFSAAPLLAQEVVEQAIDTSKYQIEGVVNANAVFVRSGGSENDYATTQLNKGTPVTVVGERLNWLKIVPPEGSFCYVAKAYVNRTGDGSIGQSTGTPYVRVGSSLNQLKTKVTAKLEPNQRVEIVGEQDEYFKIKPPADVFFYINKQFVDPVRPLPVPGEQAPQSPQIVGGNPGPATQPQQEFAQADPRPDNAQPDAPIGNPTTRPSTQPTVDAEAEFERLEKLYSQASQRPLDEQPLAELLSGYEKLAAETSLPESLRRIAEHKLTVLKGRAKTAEEYAVVKKAQEDLKSRQVALEAERKELEQKIQGASMRFYTAVGTLRTSSMQFGPVPLFRLTDPANGRTVVYIRSSDDKLGQRLGEFLGITGEVTIDTQRNMTIVVPTKVEAVDPAKVGQGIAATHTPPSLLPGVAGVDTGQP